MQTVPPILVVEDDPAIQAFAEDELSDGGLELTLAQSGEEALTLLQDAIGKYLGLVTDIRMHGGMDGWEIARRAREADPEFPNIYMTGAAADEWASKGVPGSISLTKPFAPAQLITAVSQLLNAGAPPV